MAQARFPSATEREKRAKLNELLEHGKVLVGVDATREGVELPAHLMGRPVVRLAFSRLFRLDVFEVGPFEVRANLSFGGVRHLCVVPWDAIFQMTSDVTDDDVLFADALSPEVLRTFATVLRQRLEEVAREDAAAGDLDEGEGLDLGFDDDDDDEDHDESGDGGDDDGPDEPPRRPHLRLID